MNDSINGLMPPKLMRGSLNKFPAELSATEAKWQRLDRREPSGRRNEQRKKELKQSANGNRL